jgi:hypothetical protein
VLLAIITGLLGFIAYWQYQELHSTDQTLKDTLETSRLQTRATVFFQLSGWTNEAKPRVRFNIGNAGLTATKKLIYETGCLYTPTPVAYPWRDQMPPHNYTLGPKQTDGGIPVCAEEDVIVPPTAYIYVFGRATYLDTFTKATRETQFCFRVNQPPIPSDRPRRISPVDVGTPCERHNCTDDECKNQK